MSNEDAVEARIRELLAKAPPITDEQRQAVVKLLAERKKKDGRDN